MTTPLKLIPIYVSKRRLVRVKYLTPYVIGGVAYFAFILAMTALLDDGAVNIWVACFISALVSFAMAIPLFKWNQAYHAALKSLKDNSK